MPEDLLAAGDFPDLIFTSDKNISKYKIVGVAADLNPLVKKHKMDLNRFDPAVIDTIKLNGDNNQLYGIPFAQNVGVMIYNKDLFDKFGEKAPTDGMSWSQVIALGKKMTRTEGGVQYVGFDPATISLMGMGVGLPYMDAKASTVSINNDQWQRVYKTIKEAYEIPGYIGPKDKYKYGINGIIRDKMLAMTPVWLNGLLNNVQGKDQGVNWDIVSLPNFEEAVGMGREADVHLLMMSNTSKHQDQAFQVMSVISSDENQLDMSKEGRISVLNSADVQKNYGAVIPELKGKNIAGIFKTKPRKSHTPVTDYDKLIRDVIDDSAKELATTGVDVNTLLRTTEEKANAAVEAAK
jgi:multiple sugar transport system substrate-binding protein